MTYQTHEEHIEARTRALSTLLEVSYTVASTLEMEPLLGLILDQLNAVVECNETSIWLLDGDDLILAAIRGVEDADEIQNVRFNLEDATVHREVFHSQEVIIISDLQSNSPEARRFRGSTDSRHMSALRNIRSWMGVPLVVKDRTIGLLGLGHIEPDRYSSRQAELAYAFANHAAVAIENATLYESAQELAAVEERQRLARELHDSVTQTLFAASLIAEVLPRLWERDPEEGKRCLEEVRQSTRGALAEMRTLLLELRPAVLIEMELGDLLQQLSEAAAGRTQVPIAFCHEGECSLPPDVHVALYRIAQEAVNNIAKHSRAGNASISLRCQPEVVELVVNDDGAGFDPDNVLFQSLGLGIMRERAEAIGAELRIEREVGRGTQVTAVWMCTDQEGLP